MKTVFADTFYFVALLNRSDQHHKEVAAAASQLHGHLITTEWVLMELADALAETRNRRLVGPFIRDLSNDPNVQIVSVSSEMFQRGLQLYDERQDKGWTLTDCISFIVMHDVGVTEALTGDPSFRAGGIYRIICLNVARSLECELRYSHATKIDSPLTTHFSAQPTSFVLSFAS